MSSAPGQPDDATPRPPDDFRLSYGQILRLQERIRHTLLQIRADLDSPALAAVVRALEDDHGSRVTKPLTRIQAALEELIRTTDAASREVTGELERTSGGGNEAGLDGIPPGLARFVAERSAAPGFGYETWKDPLRGWTVDWIERLEDGSVRASGRLYEKPHAWFQE